MEEEVEEEEEEEEEEDGDRTGAVMGIGRAPGCVSL